MFKKISMVKIRNHLFILTRTWECVTWDLVFLKKLRKITIKL